MHHSLCWLLGAAVLSIVQGVALQGPVNISTISSAGIIKAADLNGDGT
jgi:hypothetical protein